MNEIFEKTMTVTHTSLQHGQTKIYVRVEPVVQEKTKHEEILGEILNDENEQRYVDAQKEAEDRAERERTDPIYREYIRSTLAKCQEGGPIFGGIDGVKFQRQIRDEWEDRLVKMGLSDITD